MFSSVKPYSWVRAFLKMLPWRRTQSFNALPLGKKFLSTIRKKRNEKLKKTIRFLGGRKRQFKKYRYFQTSLSTNLTLLVRKRSLASIIGRQKDVNKLGKCLKQNIKKLLIIGNSKVGKTSVVLKLVKDLQTKYVYKKFKSKQLVHIDFQQILSKKKAYLLPSFYAYFCYFADRNPNIILYITNLSALLAPHFHKELDPFIITLLEDLIQDSGFSVYLELLPREYYELREIFYFKNFAKVLIKNINLKQLWLFYLNLIKIKPYVYTIFRSNRTEKIVYTKLFSSRTTSNVCSISSKRSLLLVSTLPSAKIAFSYICNVDKYITPFKIQKTFSDFRMFVLKQRNKISRSGLNIYLTFVKEVHSYYKDSGKNTFAYKTYLHRIIKEVHKTFIVLAINVKQSKYALKKAKTVKRYIRRLYLKEFYFAFKSLYRSKVGERKQNIKYFNNKNKKLLSTKKFKFFVKIFKALNIFFSQKKSKRILFYNDLIYRFVNYYVVTKFRVNLTKKRKKQNKKIIQLLLSIVVLKFFSKMNPLIPHKSKTREYRKTESFQFFSGDVKKRHIKKHFLYLLKALFNAKKNRFKDKNLYIGKNIFFTFLSVYKNIPISVLQSQEIFLDISFLEYKLRKLMIGQLQAISTVTNVIRRSSVGIQSPRRPISSFLFCGPTGVGKTEISKALALILFKDIKRLMRFDMSEFSEKFTVSRLIGSPPGYVGYGEGGELTNAVKKYRYCIILFDEMEKAHPSILTLLLQILDDGRLTDSSKRVINFSKTIIIMTSNVGARRILINRKRLRKDISSIEKVMENKDLINKIFSRYCHMNTFFQKIFKIGSKNIINDDVECFTNLHYYRLFTKLLQNKGFVKALRKLNRIDALKVLKKRIRRKRRRIRNIKDIIKAKNSIRNYLTSRKTDYWKDVKLTKAKRQEQFRLLSKLTNMAGIRKQIDFTKALFENSKNQNVIHTFIKGIKLKTAKNFFRERTLLLPIEEYNNPENSIKLKAYTSAAIGRLLDERLEEEKRGLLKELCKRFLPEFVNRFDEVVMFEPLTKLDMFQITTIIIKYFNRRTRKKGIRVNITSGVQSLIIERNFNPFFGARPLRRAVSKNIENIVAEYLINNYEEEIKSKNFHIDLSLHVNEFGHIIVL